MKSHRRAINGRLQLTLGELIERFEAISPMWLFTSDNTQQPKPVVFDFGGTYPVRLTSYRGSYAEIAITFGYSGFDDCDRLPNGEGFVRPTAEMFLNDLREALRIKFYGYKGGTYRMTADTPVWVAQWGENPGTAVVDVRDLDYEGVVIDTARCEF